MKMLISPSTLLCVLALGFLSDVAAIKCQKAGPFSTVDDSDAPNIRVKCQTGDLCFAYSCPRQKENKYEYLTGTGCQRDFYDTCGIDASTTLEEGCGLHGKAVYQTCTTANGCSDDWKKCLNSKKKDALEKLVTYQGDNDAQVAPRVTECWKGHVQFSPSSPKIDLDLLEAKLFQKKCKDTNPCVSYVCASSAPRGFNYWYGTGCQEDLFDQCHFVKIESGPIKPKCGYHFFSITEACTSGKDCLSNFERCLVEHKDESKPVGGYTLKELIYDITYSHSKPEGVVPSSSTVTPSTSTEPEASSTSSEAPPTSFDPVLWPTTTFEPEASSTSSEAPSTSFDPVPLPPSTFEPGSSSSSSEAPPTSFDPELWPTTTFEPGSSSSSEALPTSFEPAPWSSTTFEPSSSSTSSESPSTSFEPEPWPPVTFEPVPWPPRTYKPWTPVTFEPVPWPPLVTFEPWPVVTFEPDISSSSSESSSSSSSEPEPEYPAPPFRILPSTTPMKHYKGISEAYHSGGEGSYDVVIASEEDNHTDTYIAVGCILGLFALCCLIACLILVCIPKDDKAPPPVAAQKSNSNITVNADGWIVTETTSGTFVLSQPPAKGVVVNKSTKTTTDTTQSTLSTKLKSSRASDGTKTPIDKTVTENSKYKNSGGEVGKDPTKTTQSIYDNKSKVQKTDVFATQSVAAPSKTVQTIDEKSKMKKSVASGPIKTNTNNNNSKLKTIEADKKKDASKNNPLQRKKSEVSL